MYLLIRYLNVIPAAAVLTSRVDLIAARAGKEAVSAGICQPCLLCFNCAQYSLNYLAAVTNLSLELCSPRSQAQSVTLMARGLGVVFLPTGTDRYLAVQPTTSFPAIWGITTFCIL